MSSGNDEKNKRAAASEPPLYRPDPNFKEPFNVDTIVHFLDRIPLSPPFLLIIPALVTLYARHLQGVPLIPPLEDVLEWNWSTIKDAVKVFRNEYKWAAYTMAFIAAKTLNRTLTRIVHNNGVSSYFIVHLIDLNFLDVLTGYLFKSIIEARRWTGIGRLLSLQAEQMG